MERRRFPSLARIVSGLGGRVTISEPAIPIDCVDGLAEAYYARPEAFLEPAVPRAQSAWSFVPDAVQDRIVKTLAQALASGDWDRRHGHWRRQPHFSGSLRLIVSHPGGSGR